MSTTNLRPRDRAGLVIAIISLSIAMDPLNRLFRGWLRDNVVGAVPFWAEHVATMLLLKLVVWGAIGLLLLGTAGMFLGAPERRREAWLVGVGSGLGLTVLVAVAVAMLGPLVIEWHPYYPVMFANFASNFYEEFIFRGAILGLLLKVMDGRRPMLMAVISALLFCQGHLQYPPLLLFTVFVAGVTWAWMTIRYRSLWPAWVSHTVADTVFDSLVKL